MTDLERQEFREFNGHMIEDMCKLGEKVVDLYADIRRIAAECSDPDCPLPGMHNSDECADLIADAKAQGVRF